MHLPSSFNFFQWVRRNFRRVCALALLLVIGGLFAYSQQPVAPPVYVLSVVTDRPDAMYHVNEVVTFKLSLTRAGVPVTEGKVDWSLSKDGVEPAQSGSSELKDGVAIVTGQLKEPGMLQLKAGFKTEKEPVRGLGAAAVDPLDLRPSLPVPEDFDAFWAAKKAELAKVPYKASMTSVPNAPPGIELFDVQVDAIGDKPMRGYYARPVGAKPKSLPAIVIYEGVGVYSTRLEPWLLNSAKAGFIALEVNAHGLPNGKPDEFYQELERGALKDYVLFGRTSRDTSYFLQMFLRDLRGVDFLTSQPEWDGRILISMGTSQGAAQAIFVASQDSRVTFLGALVPAMCDHSGMMAGRVVGGPRFVPNGADGKPDAAILETSRYFDSVNFATRVRVPALFAVGFIDQITPPTSVYVAYNSITTQKEIIQAVLSPHRLPNDVVQEAQRRVFSKK